MILWNMAVLQGKNQQFLVVLQGKNLLFLVEFQITIF